jgi:hypothetical protein
MRPLALGSLAAALLVPGQQALAQADAKPPAAPACFVTVIHAVKAAGPEVPALRAYGPLLAAKTYKKWKSFQMASQSRYRLPPGGKALLQTAKDPLEFSLVSRDAGTTKATLKVGTRKPQPLTFTAAAPAQLVDGGPWQGGQLLYGVHCPAGQ